MKKPACLHKRASLNMAEEQGFEPWMGYKPMPVFKTGAFNHSATPPERRKYYKLTKPL